MKKIFFLTLILSIFVANTVSAQKATVAFYNLENLYDTIDSPDVKDEEFLPESKKNWNSARYFTKLENMSKAIKQIGFDSISQAPTILALAEVENKSVLQDLVNTQALKPYNYGIVHFDSPDGRGIDVALIFQSTRFQVISTSNKHLTVDSIPNFKTRYQMLVKGKLDGDQIHIIVNHWPSRRGSGDTSEPLRKAAAKLCRQTVDSILKTEKKPKIIILGDFNDNPTDASITEELQSKEFADKLSKDELFNPAIALFKAGKGTLPYREKWNFFDQIIVSQAFVAKKVKGYRYMGLNIANYEFLKETEGKYAGNPKEPSLATNI